MINKKRFIKYGSGILIAAALITSTLSTSILQSVQSVFADDQAPNTCKFDGITTTDYHYTCTYNNDGQAINDAAIRLFTGDDYNSNVPNLGSDNAYVVKEEYLRQFDNSQNIHQVVVNQTQDGKNWKFASVIVSLNSDNDGRRENLTFRTNQNNLFYTDISPMVSCHIDENEIRALTESANNDNPKYGNNVIYREARALSMSDRIYFRFVAIRYDQVISHRILTVVQRADDGTCMYSKAWNSE